VAVDLRSSQFNQPRGQFAGFLLPPEAALIEWSARSSDDVLLLFNALHFDLRMRLANGRDFEGAIRRITTTRMNILRVQASTYFSRTVNLKIELSSRNIFSLLDMSLHPLAAPARAI